MNRSMKSSFVMRRRITNLVTTPTIPMMTWPALIFADSRKERVSGRMVELIPSTRAKKGEIGIDEDSGK